MIGEGLLDGSSDIRRGISVVLGRAGGSAEARPYLGEGASSGSSKSVVDEGTGIGLCKEDMVAARATSVVEVEELLRINESNVRRRAGAGISCEFLSSLLSAFSRLSPLCILSLVGVVTWADEIDEAVDVVDTSSDGSLTDDMLVDTGSATMARRLINSSCALMASLENAVSTLLIKSRTSRYGCRS